MASVARPALAAADAYRVDAAAGRVGAVEEIWFGPGEEATALVVVLADGRRGLLLADDVAGVFPEDRALTMAEGATLLRLDPPHLEAGGGDELPAASWRVTGEPLDLLRPGRRARAHDARASAPPRERPMWLTLVTMAAGLLAIVCVLIALDFLFSYLVGGGPPY